MRSIIVVLVIFSSSTVFGQYPGGPPPWGVGGSGNRPGGGGGGGGPGGFNKPNRPSPFAGPIGNYGSKPSSSGSSNNNYDDPIPPNPNLDSSYDSHQLPAKLPILAPNGVVEIYNYVVDDLISKLEVDFKKREIDPMSVVIRPTPAGPVRVPGHLQKRPFRRPGAALYRTSIPSASSPIRKKGRNLSIERSMPVGEDLDKPSFRGAGKISKAAGGVDDDHDASASVPSETTPIVASASVENISSASSVTTPTTSPTTQSTTTGAPADPPAPVAPSVVTVSIDDRSDESSEERVSFFQARSDEYFPGDDDLDVEIETDKLEKRTLDTKAKPKKSNNNKKEPAATASKQSKESEEEEDDEETKKDKAEGKKDLETLMQRYQNKNVDSKGKNKYSSKKKENEKDEKASSTSSNSKNKPDIDEDQEDDVVEDDDEDEVHDDQDDHEPGTLQSAGNRPSGGYYPQGGPPALPAKPNAMLTGLSKMRRASDVTVSVDARSAMITARLLVGPLNVHINESIEPLERNVRATIPELEAEIILMERHGVVFLQRFTLDRAYGQDVEISIPKSKDTKKKKGNKGGSSSNNNNPNTPIHGPPGLDPNHPMHPAAQQRYQTKMAAHISMEVVKLLRSGNLRVNIMRTAQASMSKLKLPIKHVKSGSSKSKKTKKSEKKSQSDAERN